MRRLVYGFGGLLLLLLIAVAGVLLLLHTDYGRNLVRERLEKELSAVFVGEVRVGGVHGSLLSEFSLSDISIEDAQGEVAVAIGLVKVDYSISQLVNKTIMIDSLELAEVHVHGVRDANGTINLAELIKPNDDEETPFTWHVSAPNIVLRNSSLRFYDGPQLSEIRELFLESSIDFEEGILKAELATLTSLVVLPSTEVEGPGMGIPFSLRGVLETDSELIALQSVEATFGDAVVSLPSLLLQSDGQTNADAKIAIPVSIVRILTPTTPLLADVRLSLHAQRSNASQPIVLQGEGALGDSPLTINASIFMEQESVDVELKALNLNAQALWHGTAASNIDVKFTAKAEDLDVETMQASATVSISGKADKADLGLINLEASLKEGIAEATIKSPKNQWIDAKAKFQLSDFKILESELHLDIPRVQSLARGYSDARGDLKLDATASGSLSAIEVEGTIASKRFAVKGNQVRRLAASWKAILGEGSYSGSAKLVAAKLRSGGTDFGSAKLTVNTIKPKTFGIHLVSRGPKRSHYVNLKSNVALGKLGTSIDIDQVKLAVQGLSWKGRGGSITIGADNNLNFHNIALTSKAGHINLDGNVKVDRGLFQGNIELVAQGVNLGEISNALALDPPLKGMGSLRANLRHVAGRRAFGSVHLEFDDVGSGKEIPTSSGVVDIHLKHRDLSVKATVNTPGVGRIALEAKARGPRNPLALRAWKRLGEKALVSAQVKSSAINMAGLSHLSKALPTAGTITLDGELGAAGSLASLRIEVEDILPPKTVEPVNSSLGITLNGTRIELTGQAGIDKRVASTIAAVVVLPGPLLHRSTMSRLTLDDLLQARVQIKDVDLFWWDKILELGLKPVDAEADIDVVVAQGARNALVTVFATQKGVDAWGKPEVRTSEYIAELKPDSIDLNVRGALGKREAARGTIHLDQGWNLLASSDPKALAKTKVQADIMVLGLPLALLQTLLAPQDARTTELPAGSLLGSARVSGTLANPTVMIDAHTEGGIVAGIEFVDLRGKARYSENHLVASLAGAQKAGGTLHLNSDLRLGPLPRTKTTLDAENWDLGFLKNLVPNRSIGGLFSAKIDIKGPLEKPVITGSAQIRKGSVHPGAPLNAMRNLDVELALTPGKLTIEGKGNSGRGTLSIRGFVAMEGLLPKSMKLDLALTQVPVEAGPLSVFINTKTKLRGKSRGPDWRFDIDIGKTIVNVPGGLRRELHPDSLPDDIVFVDSIQASPTLVAVMAASPVAVIDVYVRAPETIEVRGELVRTRVDVDLHARLDNGLLLEGTVATRGGWVEVFGRRYDLRRGDIAFGGSTDPSLNIGLTHDFSTSTLSVGVSGTGSAPELDLRSDPARYDDAELLSFVLGASPDDDGSKEQSAAVRATGIASNYVAEKLQSVIRDVIPIDVLKLDISDDEAAAEKLTLGKWLTDTIFLAYRRRFEAQDLENANEAVMEYRFRKRWLLELSYGDEGTGGADVLWIRRF